MKQQLVDVTILDDVTTAPDSHVRARISVTFERPDEYVIAPVEPLAGPWGSPTIDSGHMQAGVHELEFVVGVVGPLPEQPQLLVIFNPTGE